MANDYVLNIKANTTSVQKNTKELESRFKKLNNITKNVFNTKNMLLAGAAIGGIALAVKGVVAQAAKMEDFATQFEVLTGSATTAKLVMKDLSDFAASTPFSFEGIAKAGAQLLGFQVPVDQLKERLRQIGDVAAAVNRPLDELSLVFGKVKATGKLTGETLLQFQEKAVQIGPAVKKVLGETDKSIAELVTSGKVNFEVFSKAFASLSEKGGQAYEGLIKKSKTLSGVTSTFKDNIIALAADIGKELLPVIKSVTIGFTDFARGLKEAIKGYKEGLNEDKFADIDRQISQTTANIRLMNEALVKNKKELEDPSFFGPSKEKVGENIAKITAHLKRYEEQRDALKKKKSDLFDDLYIDKDAAAAAEKVKKAAEARAELKRLALLKEEQEEREYNTRLSEFRTAKGEETLEEIRVKNEEQRIAKLEAKALELEDAGKHEEALVLLESNRLKNREKLLKANEGLEKTYSAKRVSIIQNTSALITEILGSESKVAFLASKAAALAQVFIARGTALATIPAQVAPIAMYGGPGGLAASAAAAAKLAALINVNATIQAATIGASTIKGLQEGGMIDQGQRGVDSVPALLGKGEVVVPADTSFQDLVSAGRAFADGDDEGGGAAKVEFSFKDNLMDFIDAQVIERRSIGISAI